MVGDSARWTHVLWRTAVMAMNALPKAPKPNLRPSYPRVPGPSIDYFFSPNGKGLSGVLVAFFLPAFSMASRVRVSTAS
jgi:hypothetical protein